MMTNGRKVNPDQITHHVVHPALHQDYTSDFQLQRVNDIVPTLTSPILVGIASSMHLPGRPMMPEGPETPEVREGLHGGGGALTQSAAPGPSHLGEPMEMEGEKPLGVRTIDLDATIPADLPKDPADIVILDDDELSFPGNYPEAVSTALIEVASDHKPSSEDTSPCTPPRKKRATEEMESLPPPDVSLPKGTTEKDLFPWRNEVFASDYEWVQHVRGSLLRLEADDSPSRRQIECSSRFRL